MDFIYNIERTIKSFQFNIKDIQLDNNNKYIDVFIDKMFYHLLNKNLYQFNQFVSKKSCYIKKFNKNKSWYLFILTITKNNDYDIKVIHTNVDNDNFNFNKNIKNYEFQYLYHIKFNNNTWYKFENYINKQILFEFDSYYTDLIQELNSEFKMEQTIKTHLLNQNIINNNYSDKKILSIVEPLIGMFYILNIDINELENFINDINNDNVINLNFFNNGGNLFDEYINHKWVNVCKALYRQRPIGLGTPQAMVGEGELMFIFISKLIEKHTKGDLFIKYDNKNLSIDLKGLNPRVMANINGKEFKIKTLTTCNNCGLKPNLAKIKTQTVYAVELEKKQHYEYWSKELKKLTLYEQREFIYQWLGCISSNIDISMADMNMIITDDNIFNQKELIINIIKKLYNLMINNHGFDGMLLTGDCDNCRMVINNSDDLINKIRNGVINIKSDYFRINQNTPIGWYLE